MVKQKWQDIKDFWPIYLVCFLAFIGISMPIPILTPLLIGENSPFFDSSVTISLKKFYLGLALAAYPLGEFIGSPILGYFSDKWGRKRMLITGQIGVLLGHLLSGYFIYKGVFIPFVTARFVTGLFEGTVSIAQAYLASKVEIQNRDRVFGLLTTFISLGYVAGPIFGALFTSGALSFYFVGLLGIPIMIGIYYTLEDEKLEKPKQEQKEITFIKKFQYLLENKKFKNLLIASTSATMGMTLFVDFFSGHLTLQFEFTQNELSNYWIYLSAIWSLGSLFTHVGQNKWNLKKRSSALLVISATLIAIMPFLSLWNIIVTTIPLIIGLSISMTLISVMVSNSLEDKDQGIGQGLKNSIRVFADAIILLIGGHLFSLSIYFPFLIGSGLILLAIFIFQFKRKSDKTLIDTSNLSLNT